MVCKGGVTKKMPLSLVVTASVIMQTLVPEGQNSVSKVLKIQIFPWENAFGPPTLLYTQRQLYPTNCFITKYSQGNVNSFLASAGLILK